MTAAQISPRNGASDLLIEHPRQSRCGRFTKIAIGIGSLAWTATAVALRACTNFGSTILGKTLLPASIGGGLQAAAHALLPEYILKPSLRLQLRNGAALFFSLSQIELNISSPEDLLEAIAAIGGGWLAAKVAIVFTPKLINMVSPTILDTGRTRLKIWLQPTTRNQIIAKHAMQCTGGVVLVACDSVSPSSSPHLRNLGLALLGKSCGEGVVQIFHLCKKRQNSLAPADAENEWEDQISTTTIRLNQLGDLSHVLGTQSLGFILCFTHPAAFFFAGLDIGAILESNGEAFSQGINDEVYDVPVADQIQKWINRAALPGLTAWYIYGMVEIAQDPEATQVDKNSAMAALSLMTGGAITGAAVTIISNRTFKAGSSGTFGNTVRFYTREGHLVSILPAIYVQSYMRIGEFALRKLSLLGEFFAGGAWFLIGLNLGNSLFITWVYDVPLGTQVQMINWLASRVLPR